MKGKQQHHWKNGENKKAWLMHWATGGEEDMEWGWQASRMGKEPQLGSIKVKRKKQSSFQEKRKCLFTLVFFLFWTCVKIDSLSDWTRNKGSLKRNQVVQFLYVGYKAQLFGKLGAVVRYKRTRVRISDLLINNAWQERLTWEEVWS